MFELEQNIPSISSLRYLMLVFKWSLDEVQVFNFSREFLPEVAVGRVPIRRCRDPESLFQFVLLGLVCYFLLFQAPVIASKCTYFQTELPNEIN